MISKASSDQIETNQSLADSIQRRKMMNQNTRNYRQLLNPKTLSSQLVKREDLLTLKYEANKRTLKTLAKIMKPLKRIRKLGFQNERIAMMTDKKLKILSKGLRRFNKSLQYLEDSEVSNECLCDLSEMLKRFNSLQFINLDLFKSHDESEITSEGLKKLGKSLKRLIFLQSFHMKIYGHSNLIDKDFEIFNKGLKSCNSLQSLSLNFANCRKITGECFRNLCQTLQRPTNLQFLDLNFSSSRMGDQGLEILSRGIQRLTGLKSIKLILYECGFTDKGLDILSEVLKTLCSLRSIEMNFKWSSLTDEGLRNLGKSLKQLSRLQVINLNFFYTGNGITSQGVQAFITNLKEKIALFPKISVDYGYPDDDDF